MTLPPRTSHGAPMPLTLTLTEGVLPQGQEKVAFARLSEAMLRWHGLTGNKLMTPQVIGAVQVLPKSQTFSGMEETAVVFVEWKVPAFAFTDRKIQIGYFAEATKGENLHQRRARGGRRLESEWSGADERGNCSRSSERLSARRTC